MVRSKIEEFEHDLNEMLVMFEGGENLSVRHLFSETDDRFVNTIVVKDKSYAFGTLKPKMNGEIEKKRIYKRYAKLALYRALSLYTGQTLEWGALSGVRPTRLAYSQIEQTGEFEEFFRDVMRVSDKKTQLVKNVLETQKEIYERKEENTDFFVFIPFCPSRCNYCSFISHDVKTALSLVDPFVDSLIEEIEKSRPFVKKLRSIYIGGGTPAALSDENFERVLAAVDKINTGVEYTVEIGRPDVITDEKVKIMQAHGVTRVCVNPQTLNDQTLKKIGRKHTAKDFFDAYDRVKGKFLINTDLIAGIGDESFDDFKNTIEKILSLSPDNVTVHTLCHKRGSELKEENVKPVVKDISNMVDYAQNVLIGAGYSPYYLYRQKYAAGNLENVGYCKKGSACVYNIDVMEESTDVVACGAGAISKRVDLSGGAIKRVAAPKDVSAYIGKIEKIISEKKEIFEAQG